MTFRSTIFVDESGDLSHATSNLLISVAVVSPQSDLLKQLVRDTKREAKPKIRAQRVLHAANDPPAVVKSLLHKVAGMEQVSVVVSVFQKDWWWNRTLAAPLVYDLVIADTIRHALVLTQVRAKEARIVVERRKTGRAQNALLIATIAQQTGVAVGQIEVASKKLLGKSNRGWVDCLSVPDYLAWSYYQSYAQGNAEFVEILAGRVTTRLLGIDGAGTLRTVDEEKGAFV